MASPLPAIVYDAAFLRRIYATNVIGAVLIIGTTPLRFAIAATDGGSTFCLGHPLSALRLDRSRLRCGLRPSPGVPFVGRGGWSIPNGYTDYFGARSRFSLRVSGGRPQGISSHLMGFSTGSRFKGGLGVTPQTRLAAMLPNRRIDPAGFGRRLGVTICISGTDLDVAARSGLCLPTRSSSLTRVDTQGAESRREYTAHYDGKDYPFPDRPGTRSHSSASISSGAKQSSRRIRLSCSDHGLRSSETARPHAARNVTWWPCHAHRGLRPQ